MNGRRVSTWYTGTKTTHNFLLIFSLCQTKPNNIMKLNELFPAVGTTQKDNRVISMQRRVMIEMSTTNHLL